MLQHSAYNERRVTRNRRVLAIACIAVVTALGPATADRLNALFAAVQAL